MPSPQVNYINSFDDDRERKLIKSTDFPRTRYSLAADLQRLGLSAGNTVIVHSSLRSLGWVNGGAVAYIQALQDAVTENGTIVMPTQSANYTDPGGWRHPKVPAEWVEEVRAMMPAFDPRLTPTRRMGAVPELFRTWPGAVRSSHPSASFAAWGRRAEEIVAEHGPKRIGEQSPAGALYRLDGLVALIGVGFDRNTCFHLAEYRSPTSTYVTELMPLVANGRVRWTEVEEVEFMDEATLRRLGADFEATGGVKTGRVGSAEARLFRARDCVDFAVDWLARARS